MLELDWEEAAQDPALAYEAPPEPPSPSWEQLFEKLSAMGLSLLASVGSVESWLEEMGQVQPDHVVGEP